MAIVLIMISGCSHQKKADLSSCSILSECLELSSRLTGKSYFYSNMKLDEKVGQTGSVEWTKENADFIIGELLNDAGYYRIPSKTENTYKLINGRDVRYTPNIPSYNADLLTNSPIPPANSAEPAQLIYQSKNSGRASEMARNLRPLMSRYGRVIDVTASNILMVLDTTATIHQVLPLIRKMDVPVTKEELKRQEKFRKEMLEKMKASENQPKP